MSVCGQLPTSPDGYPTAPSCACLSPSVWGAGVIRPEPEAVRAFPRGWEGGTGGEHLCVGDEDVGVARIPCREAGRRPPQPPAAPGMNGHTTLRVDALGQCVGRFRTEVSAPASSWDGLGSHGPRRVSLTEDRAPFTFLTEVQGVRETCLLHSTLSGRVLSGSCGPQQHTLPQSLPHHERGFGDPVSKCALSPSTRRGRREVLGPRSCGRQTSGFAEWPHLGGTP